MGRAERPTVPATVLVSLRGETSSSPVGRFTPGASQTWRFRGTRRGRHSPVASPTQKEATVAVTKDMLISELQDLLRLTSFE